MKRNVYLLVFVVLLTGAVMFGTSRGQQSPATAPATVVAVCDIAQVFDNYVRGKELSAEFRGKQDALRAEDDKKLKAINDIKAELDGLMEGSKEYEQRLNDIQRLALERTAWRKFQTAKVDRDRLRLTREMYREIIDTVAKVAAARGIQIVLYNKRQDEKAGSMTELLQQVELKKVLYASGSVDITDEVLAEVNKSYNATKQG